MEEREIDVDIAMDRFFLYCFFSNDHLGVFFHPFICEPSSSFSSSMRADGLCVLHLPLSLLVTAAFIFIMMLLFPIYRLRGR